MEHDRNVNSKNQIILAKTTNPSGNTRRPGINTRKEFDGRGGDTTRNRNQVNFNRSNQANIDSVKDKVIKRPHIDYRTLLDNGVSSSRKNEIFKQGMVTSTIYFISLILYQFTFSMSKHLYFAIILLGRLQSSNHHQTLFPN